jgi:hypothetical protein
MDLEKLLSDAANYPFSDWKKIFLLGFMVVLSSINTIYTILARNSLLGSYNPAVDLVLFSIGLLIGLLVYGYLIRILKTSLTGSKELPGFGGINLFLDGVKYVVVALIYSLPAIIITSVTAAGWISSLTSGLSIISVLSDPSGAVSILIGAGIRGVGSDLGFVISTVYMVLVLPIILMALANMAYYDELGAAFRFWEIKERISWRLWGVIKWYLVLLALLLLLSSAVGMVTPILSTFFSPLNTTAGLLVVPVIYWLILAPIIQMFLFRSVALVYLSPES